MNKLYNEDCLRTMTRMDKVDYVLTSPPDLEDVKNKYKTYEDYWIFLFEVFEKLTHHSDIITISVTDRKLNGAIYPKHTIITEYFRGDFIPKHHKIWVKSLKTNLYTLNYSHLLTFVKKGSKIPPQANNKPDVYLLPQKHPRIMNLDLAQELIQTYSLKGGVVYDPFMGSGTTALACINTDRNYIGSEIDKEWYKMSLEKIKK